VKHLVLGSAGQIGSALVEFLKVNGEEVLEFDIVRSPDEDLRIPRNPLLLQKLEECDFVHFLAFDVGGSRYLREYQHSYEFVANNTRIMANTFEALKQTRRPFLFASSQMSNMVFSPYGALKAVGEAYTRALDGLVVKFWNVYGVERDREKSHVITDFIRKARDTRVIDMLTDGSEERQFLYSRDCAECLLELSRRYNELDRQQEWHITSFEWTSIMDVARLVAEIYPGTQIKPGRAGDSVQKGLKNEPDPYILKIWRPKTSLRQGIAEIAARLEQLDLGVGRTNGD
jgi:nucleoside-diphosphate-sugar epimerase